MARAPLQGPELTSIQHRVKKHTHLTSVIENSSSNYHLTYHRFQVSDLHDSNFDNHFQNQHWDTVFVNNEPQPRPPSHILGNGTKQEPRTSVRPQTAGLLFRAIRYPHSITDGDQLLFKASQSAFLVQRGPRLSPHHDDSSNANDKTTGAAQACFWVG